jgi:AraC-like DNA-binding protein
MDNLAKFLRLRQSLTSRIESCKIFRESPGWHRDRVLAVEYHVDPHSPWEYAEILLSEAFHDGGRRDYFFLSLLDDCDTRYFLEADFGAGKYLRPSEPGSFVFGDEESVRTCKGIGPYHSSMIYVRKDVVYDYFRSASQSHFASPEPLLSKSFRDETLQILMKQLIYHFRQPVRTGQRMIKEHLQDRILHRLTEIAQQQTPQAPEEDRLSRLSLSRVIELMNARFTEDLSLDELAQQASVSRSYFVRRFRQTTGESPKQYLMKLRLQRAKDLLAIESKDLTVLEIAQQCGFCDQSHLAREFRQVYGITPAAFRRYRPS